MLNKLFLVLVLSLVTFTGYYLSFNEKVGKSPVITHFSWGKVVVNFGKDYQFKDCKISPGKVQEWDWDEFKTRHNPGIQIQDVQSLMSDCDIIILSRGVDLVLQTQQEIFNYLADHKKEVHWLQSEKAVEKYNQLAGEGKKVGILLHSTC